MFGDSKNWPCPPSRCAFPQIRGDAIGRHSFLQPLPLIDEIDDLSIALLDLLPACCELLLDRGLFTKRNAADHRNYKQNASWLNQNFLP
jgi:hypothetical protein